MINRRQLIGNAFSGLTLVPFIGASSSVVAFAKSGKDLQTWANYDKSVVIDGLSGAFDLTEGKISKKALSIFKRSGISALNMTVPYPGDGYLRTLKKVDKTLETIESNQTHLTLIKLAKDILSAKLQNKLGIIMGFQSTEMFSESLKEIAFFASKGVKIMQLSYNGASQFGSGGLVKTDSGVSDLGKKAIREMEKNKVLVDLSHSGKKTVASAISFSKRPLVISHTGCNAIYQHPRNNDDKELKAVAESGGLAGIYLMPFLEGGTHEIKAEMVIKHIMHALKVCGEEHVAIGSDQEVIPVNDTPQYREMIRKEVERRIAAGISAPGETPNRPPFIAELNSERRMEQIAFRLQQKGLSDRVIEKILGENWLRVFGEVWG
ncbi:MAG: dipeptidase [Kangiellaceae bacterium]|nr:dipeptidase [Kangiellaceae bacterium]